MAPKKRVEGEESREKKVETVILVLGALVVVLFLLAYIVPKPAKETTEYGVKVVSEMPLEQLQRMENIALYNSTATPAELTCKFELSAISKPDIRGYRIRIQEGDTGIYLKDKEAVIKGATQEDILRACHVFACLRDGIECPNFLELDSLLRNAKSMSIIVDKNIDKEGMMGYAELVGVLGFIQSKRADRNKDGLVDQAEVDSNEFFIYPFIKDGEICEPQPLNNLIQNWSRSNRTSVCRDIAPAIVIANSNQSAIRIGGDQVWITGSGNTIHTGAIIVRDFISPEWIRRLYNYD